MSSKLVALPCPKCRQPNPVEAVMCKCGYRFYSDDARLPEKSFPSIQVLLPELQTTGLTAAAAQAAREARPVPDVPTGIAPKAEAATAIEPFRQAHVHERPETKVTKLTVSTENGNASPLQTIPAYGELSILAESHPEPRSNWRFLVPAGALAAVLAVAGAWGGYFGPIESVFGLLPAGSVSVEQPAPPAADEDRSAAAYDSSDPSATSESFVPTDTGKNQDEAAETVLRQNSGPVRRESLEGPTRAQTRTLLPSGDGRVTEQPANEAAPAEPRTSVNRAAPVALCSDGTYSYSRSGNPCAQRGGVAERFAPGRPVTEVTPPEARTYILGPRGGCYYLNSSGRKIYVNKELCG